MNFYWFSVPATSFTGRCLYGSNEKDVIDDTGYDAKNISSCEEFCLKHVDCVAFGYNKYSTIDNCDIYRGGPYTYGDGAWNHICYIMPQHDNSWKLVKTEWLEKNLELIHTE